MTAPRPAARAIRLALAAVLAAVLAAAGAAAMHAQAPLPTTPPSPDPRIGLKPGKYDAGIALWNLQLASNTPPSANFLDKVMTDLAFTGKYVLQGSYNGFQVWDVSNPAKPSLVVGYVCPASQSDVSVYRNLLFVSGEGTGGRLDCGAQGVHEAVSKDRLRGIRIFDITDIAAPKYIANVQTCRGSHTHTLVVDPKDTANVYLYVSGSSSVRSSEELPGCSNLAPGQDSNSAHFRIEVIRVPLAHPEQAAIVSSPRIFGGLTEPATHAEAPEDVAAAAKAAAAARAEGKFTAVVDGAEHVIPSRYIDPLLDSIVKARHGAGAPTAADSAALRGVLQGLIDAWFGQRPAGTPYGVRPGPDQCHDITVYPAIGRAGGACEGYGLLLDITDVAHPKRIDAVQDSNFSYWHSATFNNAGTKVIFTDEWGGGGAPKCRATDRKEWGADAVFLLQHDSLRFRSYYKMPAPQTSLEVCVAHNGSLIPVPGRDIMVQSWYEGGISIFDFTDAEHPQEIAFFDRGPSDSTQLGEAGTWSAYWYNGHIYSSEIVRGLDVLDLVPSGLLTQNEIDAAKSVQLPFLNVQSQPRITWPATFALARAYLDQLERSQGLSAAEIAHARQQLARAEKQGGTARTATLDGLAAALRRGAKGAADPAKVGTLADAVTALSAGPKR